MEGVEMAKYVIWTKFEVNVQYEDDVWRVSNGEIRILREKGVYKS